ncbi:MAG: ATP-binding protein [Proteobacteria bacterium]|nr:ATP-binding protein [Pseudomonadota bacterium]
MNVLLAISGALVGLSIGLAALALLRLPDARVSKALLGFTISGALWAAGELITLLAEDLTVEQVGIAVLYSGSIFLPVWWWNLALRWSEERGVVLFPSRAWSEVPLLFAGAMWWVMLLNPWHGEFLEPVVGGRNHYGPLWWVMAVPNSALILAVVAVEVAVLRAVDSSHARRQAVLMLLPSGVLLSANWLYVLGPESGFPIMLPALAVASGILVFALHREALFGVLPAAWPALCDLDHDGLIVEGPDGHVIYHNRRARTLLEPAELAVGARLEELMLPHLAGHPEGLPVFDPASLGRRGERLEGVHASYEGREGDRVLRLDAEPVLRRGRLIARAFRLHDATVERQREVEVRRAHRLETALELARGVAHDFRNLLGVIRGNAELLAEDLPDEAEWRRRLQRILDSERQATELSEQLRFYAGGRQPRVERVELSEIVREVWDLLDAELSSGIGTSLGLDPTPLVIDADPLQLRRALMNLFINAAEALRENGGHVHIETRRAWIDPGELPGLVVGFEHAAGPYAEIRVADDGPGMDASTQERIFEPFFSTKGKRRGVGLSTVVGIVRAHEGRLQLSTRPGEGTEFGLFLPVERRRAAALEAGPAESEPGEAQVATRYPRT